MHLHHLKSNFYKQLEDLYPKAEVTSFFSRLCDFKLNLKRVDVSLNLDKVIIPKDLTFFKEATNRLKLFEPIQYIIGETEFYGLPFKVDKNVLIPRPETEELVSWILDEVGNQKSEDRSSIKEDKNVSTPNARRQTINILDIGTGSGCIAIALAKNLPHANIWALDVSKEALKIAQQNAAINKVHIDFIETDILKITIIANKVKQSRTDKEITTVASLLREDVLNVTSSLPDGKVGAVDKVLPLKFDIIVSNPPYVKQNEKPLMQNNVLNHEPHLALFVDNNNPLLFYDKIADFSKTHLHENGYLFFEINQSLGKDISKLLNKKGFNNIVLKQDLFGVDRMIRAANKS